MRPQVMPNSRLPDASGSSGRSGESKRNCTNGGHVRALELKSAC